MDSLPVTADCVAAEACAEIRRHWHRLYLGVQSTVALSNHYEKSAKAYLRLLTRGVYHYEELISAGKLRTPEAS